MSDDVIYPNIKVDLSNVDGNALSVVALVEKAMRVARVPYEKIQEFRKDALSGNYDHVLQTVLKYVDVDFTSEEEEDTEFSDEWEEEDDDEEIDDYDD